MPGTSELEQTIVSDAYLQALLEAVPLGIVIMDPDGHPIMYNPKAEELHGFKLQGRSRDAWIQALHPCDQERIVSSWTQAARAGRHWSETYRFRHADGRLVWVSGRAAPIHVFGRHVGFVGTLEDITTLKLTEEALRRSEARLRPVADSGMVGVYYWTTTWNITDANDKFLEMVGYTREQLVAGDLNLRMLTPERWHAIEEVKIAQVMAQGVAAPWEKEFSTGDGHILPVLVVAAALDEQGGIAICVDITERKRLDQEHKLLLDREHDARVEAERTARLREEMLSMVAHDLRQPLHIFISILNRMIRQPPSDLQSALRNLEMLEQTAQNMEGLIHDLLDVPRIDAGTLTVEKAPVRVGELLRETCALFESPARDAGISLSCEVDSGADTAVGDRARLTQVLWNLAGNALKHTPAGGQVILRAQRNGEDGWVRISVTDTGVGIPAHHLPHIFDRFWQADRQSAGAGLGLAIARGIVESHGGRIWVESTEGRGTTFYFTLPSSLQ